jgi:hypothetical protein
MRAWQAAAIIRHTLARFGLEARKSSLQYTTVAHELASGNG